MEEEVAISSLGGSQTDFSVWALIAHADPVVQGVMLILLLASLWCWVIIFDKLWRYRKLDEQADRFEAAFWSGGSLEDLYGRLRGRADHPMAALFNSAMLEWERSFEGKATGAPRGAGITERINKVMRVTMNRELERLEKYLGFLATVGSTAVFIGLFGTVWGILNSFRSIAATSNTSLTVVAGPIAEALFATAMGLVAAIPAVIAYNKLSADMNRYTNRLEGFVEEFTAILSRRLEDGET
jgi:biopolymer transport protein TolQ